MDVEGQLGCNHNVMDDESITNNARLLRLNVVQGCYDRGYITTEDAKRILGGRLCPDDPGSVVDDSMLLEVKDEPMGSA